MAAGRSEMMEKLVSAAEARGCAEASAMGYGTAGFRDKATKLDGIVFRMGILAALRSKKRKATIGLVVTASHNPAEDNGIKVVDPLGEMLEQSWEKLAVKLVKATAKELPAAIDDIISTESIDMDYPGSVFIGRDTRASGANLCSLAVTSADLLGAKTNDFGVVTTPQLHFFVLVQNTRKKAGDALPTEADYYKELADAFKELRGEQSSNGNYKPDLMFDGSNGVGAPKMKDMLPYLGDSLSVTIVNDGTGADDVLNFECGADFVKTRQAPAKHLGRDVLLKRCVSVDGDADRLIYFYNDADGQFHMLDGVKIAALVAGYVKTLVDEAGLDLSLGVVHTAYSNGSSTEYLEEEMKVTLACTPTGVKYLHHKAMEFDIGLYFEPNGHGTVVFGSEATKKIRANEKARKLQLLVTLINQATGDALSDLLLVETILHAKGWTAADWDAIYAERPNGLAKLEVADRRVVETTDAERQVVKPDGMQAKIDACVAQYPKGRSFVRPSGTENVVRVYAEGQTDEDVKNLLRDVMRVVYDCCSGVGPRP